MDRCVGFTRSIRQDDLGGSIDPSIVTDRDGTPWLPFKNDGNCCGIPTSIWSQPLSDDGLTVTRSPTELLSAEPGWEGELIEGLAMVVTGDRTRRPGVLRGSRRRVDGSSRLARREWLRTRWSRARYSPASRS